jgi:hypothetical protein
MDNRFGLPPVDSDGRHWQGFRHFKIHNGFTTDSEASLRANRSWCPNDETSLLFSENLAEGARFELAVHGVDAGFQDRWFQPLTHPSDNKINYLWRPTLFCLSIRLSIWQVPQALATIPRSAGRRRLHICTFTSAIVERTACRSD